MCRSNAIHRVFFVSCALAISLHAAGDPDRPRRAHSSVYSQPNGGPAGWQWGKQLFWEHADTSSLTQARREADMVSLSGSSPLLSAVGWAKSVRWGDTTLDTSIAFQWRDPAWVAYTFWTYAHDSLTPVNTDGSYRAAFDNPSNSYWIPFTIPMDSQDCPKGMKVCTYGDFAADRIGRLCVRANLAGLYAADFVDGLPGGLVTQYSFHPRILKAFEDSTGIKLPVGTVSEKSAAIFKYHMSDWIDFWGDAWGRFYANVAAPIRKAGRVKPLMCAQTAWDMPTRRMMAVDFRRYMRYMPSENWFFFVETQGDNLRALQPISNMVPRFGTYTSWEPDMTMGAKINVKDDYLVQSMRLAGMRSSDTATMQRSLYLQLGFTHLATRSGKVRRATQAFEYGYYDNQAQTDSRATDLLLTHFPRRPYGPAFFFSKNQLKTYEAVQKSMKLVEQGDSLWKRAPFGYFVTDAALDSLAVTSRPSAWIVPSQDRLPADERAKLLKHAPILTADSAAKVSPIRASNGGKAWGFWDHESALVVLVTNLDSMPLNTKLTVDGLKPGRWNVAYMGLADSIRSLDLNGELAMQMEIAPYDTRAYVVSQPKNTTNVGTRQTQQSRPSKQIGPRVDRMEIMDPGNSRIRDVRGRLLLPN